MMTLPDLLKNTGYAILFGLMGIIIGIWTADVLYMIILKNTERLTASHVSLIIIVFITVSASLLGFARGKKLLE